jgi:hypothetical protein
MAADCMSLTSSFFYLFLLLLLLAKFQRIVLLVRVLVKPVLTPARPA